jgi:hypothetical protein
VATTSTTHGADLLVSGVSAKDKTAQVRKYELVRPSPQATNVVVKQLGTVCRLLGRSRMCSAVTEASSSRPTA